MRASNVIHLDLDAIAGHTVEMRSGGRLLFTVRPWEDLGIIDSRRLGKLYVRLFELTEGTPEPTPAHEAEYGRVLRDILALVTDLGPKKAAAYRDLTTAYRVALFVFSERVERERAFREQLVKALGPIASRTIASVADDVVPAKTKGRKR